MPVEYAVNRIVVTALIAVSLLAACKREETRTKVVNGKPLTSGPSATEIATEKETQRLKNLQFLPPLGNAAITVPDPTNGPAATGTATANSTQDLWAKYPSGICIYDLKPGTGQIPAFGQTVAIAYEGSFPITHKVFDSHGTQDPLTFELGSRSIIKGLSMALSNMRVGGTRKIYIPAELAYGADGNPGNNIGPNQPLAFEVRLLTVTGEAADMGKIAPPVELGPMGPPVPKNLEEKP